MNKNKRIIMIAIGVILGGVAGYMYWKFIGCSSGTCAITSVWYRSTLYGMFVGGFLGDIVKDYM